MKSVYKLKTIRFMILSVATAFVVHVGATDENINARQPSADGKEAIEVCFSPARSCDQKLIALLNQANSRLDVAIYSLTHSGITEAISKAQARGVQVRVVVDRGQSHQPNSLVSTLKDDNVAVRIGRTRGIMHDKFSIVDGQTLETGSFNYTDRATNANAENQIYLSDKKVIDDFQKNFDEMWAKGQPF